MKPKESLDSRHKLMANNCSNGTRSAVRSAFSVSRQTCNINKVQIKRSIHFIIVTATLYQQMES